MRSPHRQEGLSALVNKCRNLLFMLSAANAAVSSRERANASRGLLDCEVRHPVGIYRHRTSVDQLICQRQQGRRDFKAEKLGRLPIDDEPKPRRTLYR